MFEPRAGLLPAAFFLISLSPRPARSLFEPAVAAMSDNSKLRNVV
jgi:hypothetical protein